MSFVDLLHITDTHLLSDKQAWLLGVNTSDSLDAVLGQALDSIRPDAIVVSGDIAHDARVETYAELARTLHKTSANAVRYACGNHDSLESMHEAGLDQSNLRLGAFTLVVTDTHAEGEVEGEFLRSDLTALQDALAASDSEHIIVVGHHAPVNIGARWLDKHRIRGSERLLDCLSEDARVKAYVFGHIHQAFDSRYRDVRLLATPSTCFQFKPGSTAFALDTRCAGYRHLRLHTDGRMETEVHRVRGVPENPDASESGY